MTMAKSSSIVVASCVSSSPSRAASSKASVSEPAVSDTCSCTSNNCECELRQQQQQLAQDAIGAWETQVADDDASDAFARVLEAIRLGLAKESKSRFVRDCDYMRETQRHGLKNAWRVKICRWMFEVRIALSLRSTVDGAARVLMGRCCLCRQAKRST